MLPALDLSGRHPRDLLAACIERYDLVARYSQGRDADHVDIAIHHRNGDVEQLSVTPLKQENIPLDWHV